MFKHLGNRSSEPISGEELETFEAPANIKTITLEGTELTAYCPITNQPDFYSFVITYDPNKLCLETKSLKLYIQSFREQNKFCEALANEICEALFKVLEPLYVEVELKQQVRGGISLSAKAAKIENLIY